MTKDVKVGIYKNILEYLLKTTPYSLEKIATLSNSSLDALKTIYEENRLPNPKNTEVNLVRLYAIILDLERTGRWLPLNEQILKM